MSKGTIYVAGPMTGYKNFNFFAFDEAKSRLQSDGWNVISPADIDRAFGIDPTIIGFNKELTKKDMAAILSRDLMALGECDAIYLLKGWEQSKGANIEAIFATIVELDFYYEDEVTEVERHRV